MITLFVLLTALASLVIAAVLIAVVGGAGIVLALGDVLVCALIIWGIVRLFRGKR